MKKGKIPYNSLLRSVLRVPFQRKETEQLARDGFSLGEGKIGASISTGIYNGEKKEALAFYKGLNGALAAGIQPDSVLLSLVYPEEATEPSVKACMQRFQALCEKEKIRITGGDTRFSDAVMRPVFQLTFSGVIRDPIFRKPEPGDILILTKYTGNAGTQILYRECEESLKKQYSGAFLEQIEQEDECLSVRPEAEVLQAFPGFRHDVSEGGIFAALYEMSEGGKCGFRVDLQSLPIRQETVELCEHFSGNPYTLLSTGQLLSALRPEDVPSAMRLLSERGIPAAVIGTVESGHGKVVLRNSEERFLERPERDTIYVLENFG